MKKAFFLFLFLCVLTCASFAEKFSFAVIGDNHDNLERLNSILGRIYNDKSISFVVNAGDITLNGTQKEFDDYWKLTGSSGLKVYDVVGNHDRGTGGAGLAVFAKKYGSTYYYLDVENCRLIILDNSSSKGLLKEQMEWLKQALATDRVKFVFAHKPLTDPSGFHEKYTMTPAEQARELRQLLLKNKVRYIISGHIHGYGREEADGLVQLVSAGAGAPLYLPYFAGGSYNYMKITVDGNKIDDEVIEVND